MPVLRSALFANRQTLASGLQLFLADLFFFTGFQAFGDSLMGHGHGPVALDVFFGFLVAMLRERY